ncbi:MAG: RagB/SusD family nutrient uptake outer membrane protein [Flavitalea sp.]
MRRERCVELAFEDQHYFDIKRWDIGPQVLDGPIYGTRVGTVNLTNGAVNFTGDPILLENKIFHPERHYLLPIPQSEMDANPNMVQNPGY